MKNLLELKQGCEGKLMKGNLSQDEEISLRNKIKTYSFLAESQPFDKYTMFDSEMFNDITLGLIKMSFDSYIFGEDAEKSQAAMLIKDELLESFKYMLEKTSAIDAEYYNNLM